MYFKLNKIIKETLLVLSFGILAGMHPLYTSNITAVNNTQYAAQINSPVAISNTDTDTVVDSGEEIYVCECYDDLFKTVREQLLARNKTFAVKYTGSNSDQVLNTETFMGFLDKIFLYDDPNSSSDYDYLKLSWTNAQLSVEKKEGYTYYKFTFGYLTAAFEEKQIDEKVKETLKELNLKDKDNYSKIEAINRYVVDNVSFDKSMQNKSAYTALFKGSALCRGYVLLAYKMLNDLDVPVRVITGKGNGQPHTWLIVKINDYWYNLDITWNDQTHSNNFFLKCDKEFYFHKEDDSFKTEEFKKTYSKAVVSY